MKTRRIAIDVTQLLHDCRGMGFFLREFLLHLSKFPHGHLEFFLVCEDEKQKGNFPFPTLRPKDLDASFLVWFPFNQPTFRFTGDYVVTIHDLAPFVFQDGEALLRKRYAAGAQHAKKIIVDSQFIFEEVRRFLNIHDERLCVIPLGFDPEWSKPESFDSPWPYILAVGPAEPRKNFERLLLAFEKLKKKKFEHRLVILGDLPPWRKRASFFWIEERNRLPKLSNDLGIGHDVVFPGPVSRPILSRWYRGASLFVAPSLYEGFGFPVLEAYSCSTPVACSQAASFPEVAGDGAFYFDPRDPEEMAETFAYALTNPRAVQGKKRFAENQLIRFRWEACLKKYLEIFQTTPALMA